MRNFTDVLNRCEERQNAGIQPHGAARLFHGRGHFFPGFEDITVDLFGDCLQVACFSEDLEGSRALVVQLADRLTGVESACVQVRAGRATSVESVVGEVAEEVEITEGDLRFLVRPKRNQNVGLFLDMQPTRSWLLQRATEKRVLNLFAYTCAFSVAAIAGGAAQVVNNDMSRTALDWGLANHRLNEHDPRCVAMLPHNLFKSWWKIRQLGGYDIVIIDPPTNQRGSFNAEKQYGQVLKRIPEFANSGADVITCLNSPFLNTDFLTQQMSRWCPDCRFVSYLPVSEDFPDRYPDRGLKIALFRYRG